MEHPTAGEGNPRILGTGIAGSSRSRAIGAAGKCRSVPGFDLLDTLAEPGGSTVVVQEIPREAGVSVHGQMSCSLKKGKGPKTYIDPGTDAAPRSLALAPCGSIARRA